MSAPSAADPATLRAHPVARRIKAAVLAVEPEAKVLLFGSRARGDAREDSDWDVLVLVEGEMTFARDLAVTRALHRTFASDSDTSVTAIVRSAHSYAGQGSPTYFLRNVANDAVTL